MSSPLREILTPPVYDLLERAAHLQKSVSRRDQDAAKTILDAAAEMFRHVVADRVAAANRHRAIAEPKGNRELGPDDQRAETPAGSGPETGTKARNVARFDGPAEPVSESKARNVARSDAVAIALRKNWPGHYCVFIDGEHWGNVCRRRGGYWRALWFSKPWPSGEVVGDAFRSTRAEAVAEVRIGTTTDRGAA